jgi:uncharacterized protein YecE (DUF72 family)
VEESKAEKKVRREERRARQREQNVVRARLMHYARLQHKSGGAQDTSTPPRINVGCSGWFYLHWRGIFYPTDSQPNAWFEYYQKHFQTVELNAPFYSWPTVATVKSWLRQCSNPHVVYTVKANELITHTKRFVGVKRLINDFSYIADLLGAQMGCFLYQLPPSYHFTSARLKSIVAQLDPNTRNVVEFRHASWWNEKVYSAFRSRGIIFCSCSGPKLPDALVQTADDVYIRFHGVTKWYRHDYSGGELRQWAQKARATKSKRIWAYFNNDRDGFAIKNAIAFRKLLSC